MDEIALVPRKHRDDAFAVAVSVPGHLSHLDGANTLFSSANWITKALFVALSLFILLYWAYFCAISCTITLMYLVWLVFRASSSNFSSDYGRTLKPGGLNVAQVSKPAVSPISKSAGCGNADCRETRDPWCL